MALRILVVDDHEVVRRGLRALLEAQPGWTVAGEAVTGREAVAKAKQLKPDVVILDISLPALNGVEATRQILQAVPKTEVLILTMHNSEQLACEVLAAGARGYILKSDAGRDLVAAVDSLSRHTPFFTSRVTEMVLDGYLSRGTRTDRLMTSSHPLTPREREIVQLLAEGKTSKEVAAALGISVHTAETHRTNIMQKLSLHSLTDLVRYAIRNKIIEA